MQRILLTLCFVFTCALLSAQDGSFDEHFKAGITFHDAGEYDKAIAEYEKAMAIDPDVSDVYYEIAYSNFEKGEYEKAVEYCKKSLAIDDKSALACYIVMGSAEDMLGQPQQALKTYEEGMAKFENYLLYYNYGLTSYNENLLDQAEEALIKGITINPDHASSHLVLSDVMRKRNKRVQALLSLYYFLLLEPNSERSAIEYEDLLELLKQGVKKKDEKNIDVSIAFDGDSSFSAAELLISMQQATSLAEGNEDKTDLELFAERNQAIFSTIAGLDKKDNDDFWWNFYVSSFSDFVEADIIEQLSYYMSLSQGEEARAWFDENPEKTTKFQDYFAEE